jgi:hypothetical protein
VGGDIFVAFQSPGARCPNPARGKGLTVLKVHAGSPPNLTTIWCGALAGAGSPIVTTTDGRAEPIVWIVGAEGDNRLHGFRGDTGEPLLSGNARALAGLRHFQTPIATHDRLYVAADGRVYASLFDIARRGIADCYPRAVRGCISLLRRKIGIKPVGIARR